MKLSAFLIPLLIFCSGSAQSNTEQPRPNIIFVLVDDMGWGDTSVYPAEESARTTPRIPTPNLEKLADCGIQLRRHYSAAPVCAPARASLFSGVHQGHSEVIRNNSFDAALENSHTLASVLREAGYATALIGKWGIGGGNENGGTPNSSAAWPTRRGFDYFFGYHNHLAAHRHYPREESHDDPDTGCNAIWDNDSVLTPELGGCYSTDLFTARAKKWVTDHCTTTPNRPFFLALTLTAPHARLSIPAAAYPKGGGLDGGLQWLGEPGRMINTATAAAWDSFTTPELRRHQKQWLAYAREQFPTRPADSLVSAALRHATMVTRVDAAVGDLLQLCRDLNIDQNTLIVFTSDNGPHNESGAVRAIPGHPAPAQEPAFFRSYAERDGIKRDLWDGGLTVPCLVYAPGIAKAGAVCHIPCQFHDWMATFAELAGVPTPMRCDGVSLLPLLAGAKQTSTPGIVYAEYAFGGDMPRYADFSPNKAGRRRGEQQAIIFRADDGRYLKALRTDITTGQEDFEIYDVMTDPHEARNIAADFPGIQPKLRTAVLYSRRAYDYVRDPAAGKRQNACGGSRVYDSQLVPAQEGIAASPPGLSLRRLRFVVPWVPHFDSLPGAAEVRETPILNLHEHELPAGSVSEFRGYLNIPSDGQHWQFYLTLDAVPDSRAYMKMHNFQLIDADANYSPGSTATASAAANAEERLDHLSGRKGVPLAAGWHEITLVVVQGASAAGHIRLEWSQGNAAKEPIPAEAFRALR